MGFRSTKLTGQKAYGHRDYQSARGDEAEHRLGDVVTGRAPGEAGAGARR
jgi:hypothetical protein